VALPQVVNRHRTKCRRGCRALRTRNDHGPGVSGIPGTRARTGIVLRGRQEPRRKVRLVPRRGLPRQMWPWSSWRLWQSDEQKLFHLWASPGPPTDSSSNRGRAVYVDGAVLAVGAIASSDGALLSAPPWQEPARARPQRPQPRPGELLRRPRVRDHLPTVPHLCHDGAWRAGRIFVTTVLGAPVAV